MTHFNRAAMTLALAAVACCSQAMIFRVALSAPFRPALPPAPWE